MNTKPSLRTLALLALLLSTLIHPLSTNGQGTAFTYQGQLYSGTNLASGKYDFQFALSNAPSGGMQIGPTLTNLGVGVTNGLFITTLDFGPVFTGQSNWLAIAVRTNGGSGFTPLSPLQAITPTPYAVYAESVNATNLVGTVQPANLSGIALRAGGNTFTSGNQLITSGSLGIGTPSPLAPVEIRTASPSRNLVLSGPGAGIWSFYDSTSGSYKWDIAGGTNSFQISRSGIDYPLTISLATGNVGIGTTTPAATLEVNGNAQIDGTVTATSFSGNGASLANVNAATLGGLSSGGFWTMSGNTGANPGNGAYLGTADNYPLEFHVDGQRAFRLEYVNNAYGDYYINVIGGYNSNYVASGVAGATIAGGGGFLLIGNGESRPNQVLANFGTVGGGFGNTASGFPSTVAGGENNTASGNDSFAAGNDAQAINQGAFVWADSQGNGFSSTNNDSFNVQARGGARFVTSGAGLSVDGTVTASNFVGSGSGLTNVALLNQQNTFATQQTFNVNDTDFGCVVTDGTNELGAYVGLGQCSYGTITAHGLGFFVNDGFDSMFLATNGNFGIGTSTPANKLDVQGGADFTGKVGIGTTTPKAPLDVETSSSVSDGNWGYLNLASGLNLNGGTGYGGSPSIAIYTSGNIGASTYYAFSDARIKNIIGQSDSATDLKTLLGLQITDYTYKDTIAKRNRAQKKVIAQQVEKVFPQAVSQSTNEVPDIYKRATIQDGWVQLATNLKVGERVKFIADGAQSGVYEVLDVKAGAFRTDFKPAGEKVFVYGRQVNDLRTVDYDAIAMLNVSATQELARKVDAQEKELTELRGELASLRSEKKSLASTVSELKTRDQEREDRLARIESNLEKISAHSTYVSLK